MNFNTDSQELSQWNRKCPGVNEILEQTVEPFDERQFTNSNFLLSISKLQIHITNSFRMSLLTKRSHHHDHTIVTLTLNGEHHWGAMPATKFISCYHFKTNLIFESNVELKWKRAGYTPLKPPNTSIGLQLLGVYAARFHFYLKLCYFHFFLAGPPNCKSFG